MTTFTIRSTLGRPRLRESLSTFASLAVLGEKWLTLEVKDTSQKFPAP